MLCRLCQVRASTVRFLRTSYLLPMQPLRHIYVPHLMSSQVFAVGAVNFTTPADLIAAQAAAAATPPPPGQSDADKALTNSVAAAVDLTKALTDSMSKTLQALGYSPSTAPGEIHQHENYKACTARHNQQYQSEAGVCAYLDLPTCDQSADLAILRQN